MSYDHKYTKINQQFMIHIGFFSLIKKVIVGVVLMFCLNPPWRHRSGKSHKEKDTMHHLCVALQCFKIYTKIPLGSRPDLLGICTVIDSDHV